MMPTNRALMDPTALSGADMNALLNRWFSMHAVRVAGVAVAFLYGMYTLV
jgi:hypothetical protein